MKKLLALLLCVFSLVSLLACTPAVKSSDEASTPAAAPSEESRSLSDTPTPESQPSVPDESTETPTPSEPSEEDLLEKKRKNTVLKTEDDINVIHVGLYEFELPDGRKIGYDSDGKVLPLPAGTTENTQFLVSFQNAGTDKEGRAGVRYMLYAGDTVNKALRSMSTWLQIDAAEDRYLYFNWNIEEHEDGTVSLRSCANARYVTVGSEGLETFVTADDEAHPGHFKMNLISEGSSVFQQFISEKGNIILRTSDKIEKRSKLSKERQAKLVNDLQTAYETYIDLTNYVVWESIVVRVYRNEPYFGYIYPTWNVISFDLPSAITDLGKMANRDKIGINDWSFCLLHEMGHMFDAGRGWKFNGEFSTNLKVAYVLYKNLDVDARAATAGFSYDKCFNGNEIKEMWNTLPKMVKGEGKNFDRMLYIFVTYAENIGWENMRKAYHEIQHLPVQETNKEKCYILFTDTMQKYAPDGVHINDTMKPGELEILKSELIV